MTHLEYIDDFFSGKLSSEERMAFEQRIVDDPAFAEEVVFYTSVLGLAKEQATADTKKRFRQLYEERTPVVSLRKEHRLPVRRWLAAASVAAAIGVGIFLFTKHDSPQQLAEQYVQTELSNAGVQMNAVQDSFQRALNFCNNGQFTEALRIFTSIVQTDSGATDAIKYAGLVSLRLSKYDQALGYFIRLENYPNLQSNPGKFYHALALLLRNKNGDEAEAKKLLLQVVAQDLDGKETAERLLQNL